jgi:hypothetical protein
VRDYSNVRGESFATDSDFAPHEDEFVRSMRRGMRRGAAAEMLGFKRADVLDYIDANEDFAARVIEAEGEATEHVEEALYQAAVSGNVTAAKIWLELRRPTSATSPATDMVVAAGQDPMEAMLRELSTD